ncbi:hypothetical protein [Paraburkholderia kururiensis]|nr:hypothetical protein [Paraburkholderia kururiensis]
MRKSAPPVKNLRAASRYQASRYQAGWHPVGAAVALAIEKN